MISLFSPQVEDSSNNRHITTNVLEMALAYPPDTMETQLVGTCNLFSLYVWLPGESVDFDSFKIKLKSP